MDVAENVDSRLEELLREDGLIDILRSYGSEVVLKFISKYFDKSDSTTVTLFSDKVMGVLLPPMTIMDKNWPNFVSNVFYYLLDNSGNERYFSCDEDEQRMYGIYPAPTLMINLSKKARYRLLWECLTTGEDIFVCCIVKYEPEKKEYVADVISFAEKKHQYIEDFKLKVRLREDDAVGILKPGVYFHGVVYDINFIERYYYISMKDQHLEVSSRKSLGIIKEEDTPIHYQLSKQRPFHNFDHYLGLDGKRIMNQISWLSSAFNLDERVFYSLDEEMEQYDVPVEEKIKHISQKHTEIMSEYWFTVGKDFYKVSDTQNSLKAFGKGFKYQPRNPSALVNRAAVYANSSNWLKARQDLELCLKLSPGSSRGYKYLRDVCKSQKKDYIGKANYLGIGNSLCRLLHIPETKNDVEYHTALPEAVLDFDLNDILSSYLDGEDPEAVTEDPDPDSDDDNNNNDDEEEDSLPTSLQKRHDLANDTTSAQVEDRPQVPGSDSAEETASREERKAQKKHKKKHIRHRSKEHHRKRQYREHSRSPCRRVRSRTPSPRHRRSSPYSRSRRTPSPSPPRHYRSRRSRSPRHGRYSRSLSPRRTRRSRSVTPRRRHYSPRSPSPRSTFRKSPRRRHSSSSS